MQGDLTGLKFRMLTVLRLAARRPGVPKEWVCQCDCGSPEKAVRGSNLLSGGTTSCGCRQRKDRRPPPVSRAAATMTLDGETLALRAWAKRTGIELAVLRQRKKAGWDDEKSLTTPARDRLGHPKRTWAEEAE